MEYTTPTPISRGLAIPSPTHPLIASANGNVLNLHDLHTNSLLQSLTTAAAITHITWSSTDTTTTYLAVASRGGNVVITDVDLNPIADIHDGLLNISWLSLAEPHRLVIGYEHGIGVAIFDISQPNCKLMTFIPYAKRPPLLHPCNVATRVVSPCAKFAALLIRDGGGRKGCSGGTDVVIVVGLEDAKIATQVQMNDVLDIRYVLGLRWVSGHGIIVWGKPSLLTQIHRVGLISIDGHVICDDLLSTCDDHYYDTIEEEDSDKSSITSEETRGKSTKIDINDDECKRICTSAVSVANNEKYEGIAMIGVLAGFDGRLHLIDILKGRICKTLSHKHPEADASAAPLIFRERRQRTGQGEGSHDTAEFVIVKWAPEVDLGRTMHGSSGGATGGGIRSGDKHAVSWVEFSGDGSLIASRDVATPQVVLIWDVKAMRLAVVMIMADAVVSSKWGGGQDPEQQTLAMGCGGAWVYLWERRGAAAVGVGCDEDEWASQFGVQRVAWACADSAVILLDGLTARAFVTMYVKDQST